MFWSVLAGLGLPLLDDWVWGWLFFLLWGGGLCILGVRLLGCLSWLCY